MEVIDIPKRLKDINQIGGIWATQVTIPTSSESAAYILPINPIYAIALEWDGVGLNPAISFSIDSKEDIEADESSVTWNTWNKTDEINLGITAIKFDNASATVEATAKIVIKGHV